MIGKQSDKKKVKYNVKDSDENDALSDSKPSDDNLDTEDIMKLIPKKFGKSKYLKGVFDKKKKQPETEKKVVKKPKTTLMPCMSSSKKERENKIKAINDSAKKVPVYQSVVT